MSLNPGKDRAQHGIALRIRGGETLIGFWEPQARIAAGDWLIVLSPRLPSITFTLAAATVRTPCAQFTSCPVRAALHRHGRVLALLSRHRYRLRLVPPERRGRVSVEWPHAAVRNLGAVSRLLRASADGSLVPVVHAGRRWCESLTLQPPGVDRRGICSRAEDRIDLKGRPE